MIASKELDIITSLKPDEQVLLISLAKNMVRSHSNKTEAQKRFSEIRKKYAAHDYSMEEIDRIIHQEVR